MDKIIKWWIRWKYLSGNLEIKMMITLITCWSLSQQGRGSIAFSNASYLVKEKCKNISILVDTSYLLRQFLALNNITTNRNNSLSLQVTFTKRWCTSYSLAAAQKNMIGAKPLFELSTYKCFLLLETTIWIYNKTQNNVI